MCVQVTVRLFAGLREQAGVGERVLKVPDDATVAAIWPALGLKTDEPAGLLYAVNKVYAERDRPLADGDEVALIPPVSGGSFRLVEAPIDLPGVIADVADERAGGI